MMKDRFNFSAGGRLLETYADCYCVRFEYEKEKSAREFFSKVGDFLLCMDRCNNALLSPFGVEIDLQSEIEFLEFGSLKSWLKDTIEKIDDEAIKRYCNNPRELFADLLVKLKNLSLEFLSHKDEERFLKEYKEAIETTSIKDYGYSINAGRIFMALSDLSKSGEAFNKAPIFIIDNKEYSISGLYEYKALRNADEQISSTKGIFTIKKPDLAGNSQWEVIGDRVIKVRVEDSEFLRRLKDREILIGYGERIEAVMITRTFIDKKSFEVLENEYILKEIRILPQREQKTLLR